MEIPAFEESKWTPPRRALVHPMDRVVSYHKNYDSKPYMNITCGKYNGKVLILTVAEETEDGVRKEASRVFALPERARAEYIYTTNALALSNRPAVRITATANGSPECRRRISVSCPAHKKKEVVQLYLVRDANQDAVSEFKRIVSRVPQLGIKNDKISAASRFKALLRAGVVSPDSCVKESIYQWMRVQKDTGYCQKGIHHKNQQNWRKISTGNYRCYPCYMAYQKEYDKGYRTIKTELQRKRRDRKGEE